MNESLALKHSIQLEKLMRRFAKLEEKVKKLDERVDILDERIWGSVKIG